MGLQGDLDACRVGRDGRRVALEVLVHGVCKWNENASGNAIESWRLGDKMRLILRVWGCARLLR